MCLMFVLAQITHTVYHEFWPHLGHCDGPEMFNQTVLLMWLCRVVPRIPKRAWYRGKLGKVAFTESIMTVSWAVLAAIYSSNSAQQRDNIDVTAYSMLNPG